MKCLNPIKVYDSYVACGTCVNCKAEKSNFSLSELQNMCAYQELQENLVPNITRQNSYKKWWKRYVKIQKKIVILKNKIRKLEGKI